MTSRRSALSLLAASMLLVGGGAVQAAPIVASSSPVVESVKSAAKPERRRTKKYMHLHDMLSAGLGQGSRIYTPSGRDWILRRTKNFRRKGVGARWRFTCRGRA